MTIQCFLGAAPDAAEVTKRAKTIDPMAWIDMAFSCKDANKRRSLARRREQSEDTARIQLANEARKVAA